MTALTHLRQAPNSRTSTAPDRPPGSLRIRIGQNGRDMSPPLARFDVEHVPCCGAILARTRTGTARDRGTVVEHGTASWTFAVKQSTVQVARRLVRAVCRVWQAPSLAEPAELVASELVGNVVRAGGTEVTMRLAWTPRRLRLEVCDTAPGTVAAVRRPSADADVGWVSAGSPGRVGPGAAWPGRAPDPRS